MRNDKISEYEHRQKIKEQRLNDMGFCFHDEHIFDSTREIRSAEGDCYGYDFAGRENYLATVADVEAKIQAVWSEVEAKIEKEYPPDHPLREQLGFCHCAWAAMKKILKEDYGIDWMTPAELAPHVNYD